MSMKRIIKIKPWNWILPIGLVSLVFIVDHRYFLSPPLRSDDWEWIVWSYIFEPLKAVDWTSRRPLFSSLLSVLTPVFGLNIQWYYIFNWLLLFISGILLFLIIRRSFPKHNWIALPVALIFLIYPVNYARTWLIIFINNFALLLALCAIFLMVSFSQSGKIFHLLLGNILFLISLAIYEAGLGIVMLAALLLCCFACKLSKKRRLLIMSFWVTALIFITWRVYIQPNLLNVQDFYLGNLNLSIPTIAKRYIQGLFIFLFNWVGPFLFGFGDLKYWVFLGICGVLIIVTVALLPRIIKSRKENVKFLFSDRIGQVKSLLLTTLIGGLFWVAGYIPVISLYQPTFYGDSSRVNFSSIPGAALALAAGIVCLSTLVIQKKALIKRIVVIVVIALVILGMVYQVRSQNERVQVWEINKDFWQAMFELIPGLEDGTIVVICIPGYEDLEPFEMLPFRGDWEAQSALTVLYNNASLFAEYYYLDIPEHSDNWTPTDPDLSRYVFLVYDPASSVLKLIEDPQTALAIPFDVSDYEPRSRIIEYQSEMSEYRFLVDQWTWE